MNGLCGEEAIACYTGRKMHCGFAQFAIATLRSQ